MNIRKPWNWVILPLFLLAIPWLTNAKDQINPTQEIIVTGTAEIGRDHDSAYRNAILDAFRKAFDQVHSSPSINPVVIQEKDDMKKDLVKAQQELGINEYKVLRYWREQDLFNIQLKVFFGSPKVDQPRTDPEFPRLNWIYQTQDQILTLINNNSMLAVWTPQTIEVLDPKKGKRTQWIKTGLNRHTISTENYLVQDGDYLKLCNFKKFNMYNLFNYSLVYKWRKKIPDLIRFYLSDEAAYSIERTGLIRAFQLENGKEKWRISANSQVELEQLAPACLLMILPNSEIWMINEKGHKLWGKKFTQKLAGLPISHGEELYCIFEDGRLNVFNLYTGEPLSEFNIKFNGEPQKVFIKIIDQKLFLFYNNLAYKGYLQTYHRYTGSLIWNTSYDGVISDSIAVYSQMVIVGSKNTFEARDMELGLKLWDETVGGRISEIGIKDQLLLIVAGERVFGYMLE